MLVPAVYLQRCPVSNCRLLLQKPDESHDWHCPKCGWRGDRHLFLKVVWRDND